MSKTNKGGYQILDFSFFGNLKLGENYIKIEFTDENYKQIFVNDNIRNFYNTISNPNNRKTFVITGLTYEGIEYRDILVRNVEYSPYAPQGEIIAPTLNPIITLKLYNGTSIIIGYNYIGYDTILIEITGGID